MKINTVHVRPPLPIRCFDWCAHRDGYDGASRRQPVGRGATEAEALADLRTQMHPDLFEAQPNTNRSTTRQSEPQKRSRRTSSTRRNLWCRF